MKRYCRKILEQREFLETVSSNEEECRYEQLYKKKTNKLKQKHIEKTNFKEIVQDEIYESSNTFKILTGKKILSENLANLLDSTECELDFWNDVYLALKYASGEKRRLFVDDKDSKIYEKIEVTLKNLMNDKIKNKNTIFDAGSLNTTAKKTEVRNFGVGVMQLWLGTEEFKEMFISGGKRANKSIKEIIDVLESDEINYELDDIIILEKILGLNTELYFLNCIAREFTEEDKNDLSGLLEKISAYGLPFSRCHIIEVMGTGLDILKQDEDPLQALKDYGMVLEYYLERIEMMYDELLEQMLKELLNRHSYKAGMEIAEKQRQRILKNLQKRQCVKIEEEKKIRKKADKKLNKKIDKIKEIYGKPEPTDEDIEYLEMIETESNEKELDIIAEVLQAPDNLAFTLGFPNVVAVNEEEHEKDKADVLNGCYKECGLKYPYLVNGIKEKIEYKFSVACTELEKEMGKTIIDQNLKRYQNCKD